MEITEGILEGDVFLFNIAETEHLSLLWEDDQIQAKSKDGYLTFKDKFYREMYSDKRFIELFKTYPELEIFGLWDEEKFIVTDMMHTNKETKKKTLQHFEYYHQFLAHFDIHYRMPLIKLISPSAELLEHAIGWKSGVWNVKNYSKQLFQLVQVTN